MGIGKEIGELFGGAAGSAVTGGIGSVFDFGKAVIERIWPDPAQRAEALQKLEELRQSGELSRMANDTELFKAEIQDRDSARQREVAVKDSTPKVLAGLVTIGFFGLLGLMAFHELPAANREALAIMLGTLAAAWAGIVAYYFGSSSGGQRKTDALVSLASKGK